MGECTLTLKIERILGYYHNIALRTSQTIFFYEYDLTLWRMRSVIQAVSLSHIPAVRHVLCH